MHPNAELITKFYDAFSRADAETMVTIYAPNVVFSDPVFPDLKGEEVGKMWRMLCKRAKNFSLTFEGVEADDTTGSAHWEARYLFGGKRPVHNIIDAKFKFENGRVVEHRDHFDFYRWSKQAIGAPAVMLGWTGTFQRMIQGRTRRLLDGFQA
jgi:limonene-1,2-epoxide hydrolase